MLNTLCGSYAIYGLSGLRYAAGPIILFGVLMVLQAVIAIQLLTFCVYLTPNQVSFTQLFWAVPVFAGVLCRALCCCAALTLWGLGYSFALLSQLSVSSGRLTRCTCMMQ